MIIDTADDTTKKLSQLKAAGCTAIIRYDDRFSSGAWKQITPSEARAIKDAGILLGIVYEHGAQPSGEQNGFDDATYSVKMAASRGQPKGSAVYFAVDYDASTSDINNKIIPYFRGVNRGIGTSGLRVGVYGSGATCKALKAANLVTLTWITCSRGFTGSSAYIAAGLQDLWQTDCDKNLLSLSVDYNSARNPNWGAFVPWGDIEPTPTPKPLHNTAWVQTALNTLGQIPPLQTDGISGPKTQAAIKVFQRQHDLVPDGIAGPLTQAAIEDALMHVGDHPPSTTIVGPMRYLIDLDADAGMGGTVTEVGYDAIRPPSNGFGVKYGNLYDQEPGNKYGPYLPPTDTAAEYGEQVPDPKGAGFLNLVTAQCQRAKAQGFAYLELDNPDGYATADVLRALDVVGTNGLKSIAKNAVLMNDAVGYLQHPTVVGLVVEEGAGSPWDNDQRRVKAGKPTLPVWFVFFGPDGLTKARQTAAAITAGGYKGMGVTNSPGGEYNSADIVLKPQ